MATIEEKILAYLDGSLPPADHEDVRAKISNGDDRVAQLLNAHVRLESLYALTAPPISAPLSVQRELALKVPVLALKLPYLATPEERRKAIALGWWDSFWASRINVILLVISGLLAGGIWYAVRSRQSSNNPVSPERHIVAQSSIAPNINSSHAAVKNIPSEAPSHSYVSAGIGTLHMSSVHHRYGTQSDANRSAIFSRTNRRAAKEAHGSQASELSKSPPPGSVPPPEPAQMTQQNQALQAITNHAASLPPVAEDLPPLSLHSITNLHSESVILHSAAAMPIPITIPTEENSYIPLRAFIEENVRSMSLPVQSNGPSAFARNYGIWQTSVISEGLEFGIDYELSPWILVGARGGDARFLQAQELIHTEPIAGYNRESKTVTETTLLDPFAAWAGLAATYIFNPARRFEYAVTGAAGNIFNGGFSPTLLGEITGTYALNGATQVRTAFSYQAAWVTNATPLISSPLQANSSAPGVAIQSVTNKLFPSQAFGFSLGITFHP